MSALYYIIILFRVLATVTVFEDIEYIFVLHQYSNYSNFWL